MQKTVFEARPAPGGGAEETYRCGEEIRPVAERVIEAYHPHLARASIAYIFRSGRWEKRGRTITGRALVPRGAMRYLIGCDLVLVINEKAYRDQEDEGRLALLDHELSHFNPPARGRGGEAVWSTRDHDISEFSEVVKRHNICTSNLCALAGDREVQLDLIKALSNIELKEKPPADYKGGRGGKAQEEEIEEEFFIEELDEEEPGAPGGPG